VELRELVRDGTCAPETLRQPGRPYARAVDLGSGAGTVSIELAQSGFDVTGVDFSPVAVAKARRAADAAGVDADRLRFVQGDLTAGPIDGVEGPFDLLVDYGTLDDLPEPGRAAMARYVTSLARPGSRLFMFEFAGDPSDLPRFSFSGPSRAFPGMVTGEVERWYGASFAIRQLAVPTRTSPVGCWLLERRPDV
jgi:SAM-dependent methyltransferase